MRRWLRLRLTPTGRDERRTGLVTLMPLSEVLRDWRDGDEHGWDTEFAYLREFHAGRLDMLATSIWERGFLMPILLGSDGRVWDGHHRLCVADMLALSHVPIEYAA